MLVEILIIMGLFSGLRAKTVTIVKPCPTKSFCTVVSNVKESVGIGISNNNIDKVWVNGKLLKGDKWSVDNGITLHILVSKPITSSQKVQVDFK
jgi:hypothetical protein